MNYKVGILIAYALLVAIGGFIGYFTAGSIASLIMGSISGALLLVSAWGLTKNCKMSYILALVLTWGLTAFFAFRFYNSMKFMPAGLMAIISFLVAGALSFCKKSTCCAQK